MSAHQYDGEVPNQTGIALGDRHFGALQSGLLPRLASPISGGCPDYWRTLLQHGVLSSRFRTQCVEAGRLTDRGHRPVGSWGWSTRCTRVHTGAAEASL